jgi:hypothetical protein
MRQRYVLWMRDPNGAFLQFSGAPYRKISKVGGEEDHDVMDRAASLDSVNFGLSQVSMTEEIEGVLAANRYKVCYSQTTGTVLQTPDSRDWEQYEPPA